MTLISKIATPAELFAGCVFAEDFRDNQAVVQNGGNINGIPEICNGAVFNGTNEFINYIGSEGYRPADRTIIVKFSTTVNDSSARGIFNRTALNDDFNILLQNGTLKVLRRTPVGWSTVVTTINISDGKPHVAVVLYDQTTHLMRVYVDGILDGQNTLAFDTLDAGSALRIGRYNIFYFPGTFYYAKMFCCTLDVRDTEVYTDGDVYGYRKDAFLDFTFDACRHDPSNVQANEISENENYATFGDGATPTTYPTKLGNIGYGFDGGDYMLTPVLSLPASGPCTFAVGIDAVSATDYILVIADAGLTNIYGVLLFTSGQLEFYTGSLSAPQKAVFPITSQDKKLIVGVYDGTTTKLYMNGVAGTDAPTPLPPVVGGTQLCSIGANPSGGSGYNGNIYRAFISNTALSAVQRADLYLDFLKSINNV